MQEMQVQFLGQEDTLEKEMATNLVFLPGKSHGQWSLVGYSSWGLKEMDTTELFKILFDSVILCIASQRKPSPTRWSTNGEKKPSCAELVKLLKGVP